ncbi:hypothetical protein E2C01_065518 [Portunus trituberculatus]|uniref:Uncharacterized protein n=1 Tax=Portunus trituberculatus TaxID=210409 RepID=A0A5B7HMS8_PORTR|nr:hypothetical protein [Portunus trituberculatus]
MTVPTAEGEKGEESIPQLSSLSYPVMQRQPLCQQAPSSPSDKGIPGGGNRSMTTSDQPRLARLSEHPHRTHLRGQVSY